ncbi:MAG: 23S rRNA (uracil(1939)-C(5))-methyltransferase RlmD [Tissierellia bacterium]|nr:23S rRNA (uracil(1939)-C(5))-methyltransferase RlmD [Tissierellia bacterium]
MTEIIELEIRDINSHGNGVGELDKLVYFVEGATLGEICKAEVIKKKKSYAMAKKIETVKESPYLAKPKCKYFGKCTGCVLQDVEYSEQLELKKKSVIDKLNRLAGEDIEDIEIISMGDPYFYRNKIELKVSEASKLGYYGRGTHRHVEIDECVIASEEINNVIPKIQEILDKYKIPGYNNRKNSGVIKNVTIRSNYKGQIQLTITFATNRFKNQNDFLEDLEKIEEIAELHKSINTNRRDESMGDRTKLIYENSIFSDKIGDLEFIISPKSFFQVNKENTRKLYDEAVEQMQLKENEKILDLYSGIGTIPNYISKYVKSVDGVEIVKDAVKDAEINSEINKLENIKIYLGKSEKHVKDLILQKNYDAVIVDPPRKGLEEEIIHTIGNSEIKKIQYISCDPATLARDIKALKEYGFKISKIKACDMFPQTIHVETVVLMSRVEK